LHGDFLAAAARPREHQIRQVRAGYEPHSSYGSEDREQGRPERCGDTLNQRNEVDAALPGVLIRKLRLQRPCDRIELRISLLDAGTISHARDTVND
jgi:hypothetical protein